MNEGQSGLGRFGGNPKELKNAPTTLEDQLKGVSGQLKEAAGERGTKPFDMDCDYGGNVQGCMSRPVSVK